MERADAGAVRPRLVGPVFETSSKISKPLQSPKPKPKAPPVDTMIVTIPEGSQPGDELSFHGAQRSGGEHHGFS